MKGARSRAAKLTVVEELAAASRAALVTDTACAKASFREWQSPGWLWNDEVWFCADREGFKIAKRVRDALAAYDADVRRAKKTRQS